MPSALDDPTQAVHPNFEGPEWEFLRQAIVDSHPGEIPLTGKEAARLMRVWTRNNDARITAWNAQLANDRAEQVKRDKLARKVKEAQRVQLEKEAQEQRRLAEKNKPKINSFDPTRSVSAWIVPPPAPYALEKINELEYVELDYFTALRPSNNIRSDEDLSWEEMLDAKDSMLHFITQSGLWPTAHSESLAAFFIALAVHPRTLLTNGKKALLLYQSRVRREWFDSLERNKGFNIGRINDKLVLNIAEEVNYETRNREIDQVRTHGAHVASSR